MSDFVGKTIGEYQLLEIIAESDETLVFKAFQPKMNRYVAFNVLKPHVARVEASAQRFLQAAQLAAQMGHPNILPVYDSGQAEGVVYSVSPLIEGGTLRGNLAWFHDLNQALGLFRQLTAGLEYIHSQGYVHGNLKSSNTLMDVQRRPLLSEFGMAQPLSAAPDPYLSPEQVQGGMVDRRTDVYALGILLYEVLVGQTPPPGMVASPRARRPDLPEAIERVYLRAVAQSPDQRFQSVGEFQTALVTALQAPAPAPPPQPAYQPPPPSVSQTVSVESQKEGTNWLAIILGVLLVGALCVGGFFGVRYLLGARGTETAEPLPTQPPGVTVIVPTVVLPTQPPPDRPTRPPQEPPTEPPQEPPTEEPPIEEPPEAVQPLPPGENPPGDQPELPDVCGSVGMAGAIAVLGIAMGSSKRRRKAG